MEDDGTLRIGSLTSFSHITRDPLIQKYLNVLGEAVDQVGGPQIRNIGTIGGNTCNGVTSADSASTLHAYDAIVELTGPDGVRRQPIREFYIKAGKVDIRPGEIQTAILIEKDSYTDTFGHYIKYAMRNAMDIATLGTSVNVRLSADKQTVERARVAFGVAGPVPLRAETAEALAAGQPVSMDLADRFARAVKEDIHPRDSWRATKDFRNAHRGGERPAGRSLKRSSWREVTCDGGEKHVTAVSDGPFQPQRQGRGAHGGRAGQPHRHAPQRLPDDLREEGLRGGGVRRPATSSSTGRPSTPVSIWQSGRRASTSARWRGCWGPNGELSDIQQAFAEEAAIQCGFCTPGFILTAVEILESGKEYTDAELRKLLSGHLCRCTGYENILRAVKKTMYRRLGRPMPEA